MILEAGSLARKSARRSTLNSVATKPWPLPALHFASGKYQKSDDTGPARPAATTPSHSRFCATHSSELMRARRKGEPRKVELAWELRSQTTMPLAWIAERLNLGTRGHLAWLTHHRGQSRLAVPADPGLLRI
jgi:hypothetical protein